MNMPRVIEEQPADHRRWLRELELAHFEPTSPGMPYWLPHGVIAMRALQDHWRRAHERWGYQEVSTPPMARDPLYLSSGHLPHYEDNMFFSDGGEGGRFGLKPVNCPGTMVIFRSRRRSHRELPVRFACFDVLYRNELSGVLSGMLRLQAFRQDDAHIFLAPRQIRDEVVSLVRLAERIYAGFGLRFKLRLGGPPESRIGDDATWASAEASLASALDAAVGQDGYHRAEGEGGFYGPKVDLLVSDSLGRDWQVGTIQLDHEMPRRLGCMYTGPDGREHVPAVIHRALLGSFERFLGILLEHADGCLPPFMAPVQVRLVPVADRHRASALSLASVILAEGFRVELERSNQRVEAQVRDALLRRVPLIGVIGDREVGGGTVSLRTSEGADLGAVSQAALIGVLRQRCRPPEV